MTEFALAPLSQVPREPIRWLWPGYLARGKLALLDGDPGVGKSLLTLDIAARLSRGGPLPDGAPTERPQTVLRLAAEDDAADTTRPRAEAAGADLDRLIVVTGSRGAPLQFPDDLPALAERTIQNVPDLIILDPVMAFLAGNAIANSEQCVRRVLAQLGKLAESRDAAILMIRHLRKATARKAQFRGMGSVGFIASVRTGLFAARDPSDPTQGILAFTKANLSSSAPSLGYRIRSNQAGEAVVEWTGPLNRDADELGLRPEAPLRMRDKASGWLQQQLAGGPVRALDLYAAAAQAGIPDRTLERAKSELEFCSHRLSKKDGTKEWYWYDPAVPWPKNSPFKKPFELPPLEDLM